MANVAVRTREGGARFVDLDGGGLTYWPDPRGGPLRIDLPGAEGLSIRRLGAEANPKLAARENPPAGVLDTALELSVGPKLRLKARWTRPAAAPGPLPGVLLLPDAGPRDADGRDAAGRNPILRDLAWTLAGQGFATLRFEKRGDHPRWKQLIADGRVALKSLRSSDGHSGQIALLGVGEGALLAAEIARADGKVAGLAYLGAPHRALSETLELRLRHDLLEAQLTRTELQAELDELRSGLSVLRKGPAESLAPDERLVHDLLKISPVSTTVDLAIPRLWIFAERDPETRQSDINRLRTVLALQGEAPWKLERLNDADARFRRLGPTDSPERDGADPTRPLHPSLPLFLAEHFRKALKG